MKANFKFPFEATLCLYIVCSLFFSCKEKAPDAVPPTQVDVVAVERKDIQSYDQYPTNIQGIVNNDVRAKISGYIKEVYVDEGQKVVKGQPLFRLETNILTENARAASSGVNAAEADIASAQSGVNVAQVEVNRLIPLVEKNIISPIQLETAKAQLNAAKSRLKLAQAGRNQANANLSSVRANIDYSIIRAPISGMVGNLPFKQGSLVGPTDPTPLTIISDTRQLYAYFALNEVEYLNFLEATEGETLRQKLANLPPVQLVLANGQVYKEKGKIETVTGQIDQQTGTIQFRALFPNAYEILSNGNTGVIRIPKYYSQVLVVPESATLDQQGIVHVFTIKKDSAISTIVKVKNRVDNIAIIDEGLKEGQSVIALGVNSIQNGMPVKAHKISFDSLINAIKPVFE